MINLSCQISEDISAGCDVRTWKISSIMSYKHNKRIFVQAVTSLSEPGKYPLSCHYKHIKMTAKFNELKLALTS